MMRDGDKTPTGGGPKHPSYHRLGAKIYMTAMVRGDAWTVTRVYIHSKGLFGVTVFASQSVGRGAWPGLRGDGVLFSWVARELA